MTYVIQWMYVMSKYDCFTKRTQNSTSRTIPGSSFRLCPVPQGGRPPHRQPRSLGSHLIGRNRPGGIVPLGAVGSHGMPFMPWVRSWESARVLGFTVRPVPSLKPSDTCGSRMGL